MNDLYEGNDELVYEEVRNERIFIPYYIAIHTNNIIYL